MYRLIFWPVLAPSFLFAVGTGATMPLLILAALQLGASEALASALVAISGAAALASTVPVGVFIDRVGDRRAMALATTVAGALLLVTVMALAWPTRWSLVLYIAAFVLRSPAGVAWSLARQAVVADALPSLERGRAMTALGGTMRAGNLVGPMCGAALLALFPMWSVFLFSVLMAVAATALLYVRRLNAAFDATAQRTRTTAVPQQRAEGVRWKAVWFAGISILTLAAARVAQPILIALWGSHLGWHESQISLIVAVGAAVELVLMFPGGYLKDQLGRSPVLAACLTIYGLGFILAPVTNSGQGFVVAVVVMSIGNGLGAGINMTIGADLSPPIGRAKFLSIWAMFSQASQLSGPLAISAMLLTCSLPVAMTAVGGFAVGGAVWALATQPITQLPMGALGRAAPR